MKMISCFVIVLLLWGCMGNANEETTAFSDNKLTYDATGDINFEPEATIHTVTVLEVLQVDKYTYLRVKESGTEYWLAGPTISTKPGDILYYETGMTMVNFQSKELKRTFEKILFVDRISADRQSFAVKKAVLPSNHPAVQPTQQNTQQTGASKTSSKQTIKIDPAKNGVAIAALLKDPKAYEGKTIILRGKITKYTSGVMGKNWVHIQDGTEWNGKFEIVITTLSELKVDETVTFEGKISLNKDLGFGYFFDVLMEDAKAIK